MKINVTVVFKKNPERRCLFFCFEVSRKKIVPLFPFPSLSLWPLPALFLYILQKEKALEK